MMNKQLGSVKDAIRKIKQEILEKRGADRRPQVPKPHRRKD